MQNKQENESSSNSRKSMCSKEYKTETNKVKNIEKSTLIKYKNEHNNNRFYPQNKKMIPTIVP